MAAVEQLVRSVVQLSGGLDVREAAVSNGLRRLPPEESMQVLAELLRAPARGWAEGAETLMLVGHGRDFSDVIIDGRFVMVDRQIPGRDEVDDNRRAQRQFEGLMRKYPERTVGHPPIGEIFSSSYPVLRADRPAS